ncbi:MAG: MerR family DNA-binding protein, partial [Mailhella sp.]|nr:MerR family DNA-binding protein [Mailhella sp.]
LHCRLLGFSLSEIRELLAFKDNPCSGCGWINELVEKHIARIDRQIAALQHFKSHFEKLRFQCDGTQKEHCGILASLDTFDLSCCRQMHDMESSAVKD